MKILNLYAGIGGNRKLWGDEHEITAVEHDSNIAAIYKDYFPNDEVIVTDAHQYLLDHFREFDFIWSSPPCPSHSLARTMAVFTGQNEAIYPDMSLYQEIILLERFHKKGTGYCVENVKPYYKPLIGAQERDRHLFWANFYITEYPKTDSKHGISVDSSQRLLGYDLSKYNVDKRKILRNCVLPEVGAHILDCYINQTPSLL